MVLCKVPPFFFFFYAFSQVRPPGVVLVPVPVDRGCPPDTGPDWVFLEEGPHRTGPDWVFLEEDPHRTGPDWVFVEEVPHRTGPDWVSRPVSCPNFFSLKFRRATGKGMSKEQVSSVASEEVLQVESKWSFLPIYPTYDQYVQ